MSLINVDSKLWGLAKDRLRLPRMITGHTSGRHGMVKRLVQVSAGLYGAYFLASGPVGLMYKKHFTLQGDSSILSLPLCHFSHTNMATFLFNSGILWTIGNMHAKKFGCAHFTSVLGISCAAATALGVYHVMNNNEPTIAGGMAASAGLVTYNVFANPHWFKVMRLHPYSWVAAFALYGAFGNDKAAVGGIAGGYLAFLFL